MVGSPNCVAFCRDRVGRTKVDHSFPVASSTIRIPRRGDDPIQAAATQDHAEEVEPVPWIERAPTNILHYVDFGGHTGENGAFGWYADFPAHQ